MIDWEREALIFSGLELWERRDVIAFARHMAAKVLREEAAEIRESLVPSLTMVAFLADAKYLERRADELEKRS